MKNKKIKNILFILSFFLITLFIGNFVLFLESDVNLNNNSSNIYLNNSISYNGNYSVVYNESIDELRPNISGFESLLFVFVGVFIGTFLFLILLKFKKTKIAKGWFFLSYLVSIWIFLSIFVNQNIAFLISLIIVYFKIFKSNQLIHNVSEIMIYTAISYIFVPIFNLYYMFILLIIISIYDYIAVFKSKHMVVLAKSQSKMNLFTGFKMNSNKSWFKFNENKLNNDKLNIKIKESNYNLVKSKSITKSKSNLKVNFSKMKKEGYILLGGGDVIFSMLFTGTVFTYLLEQGISKIISLMEVYFISISITLSLFFLFYYSKKTKFYPAMPIVSIGAFIGFLMVFLFNFLI